MTVSLAHVVWQGGVGGIERIVQDLAEVQISRGDRVAVAVAAPEGGSLLGPVRGDTTLVHLRLGSGYDLHPLRLARTARTLSRFDVLHLHGFNVPLAIGTALSRRPVVYTEHGNFGLGRSLGLPGHVKRSAQRRFLRRVSVVAANSHHTARRMTELYDMAEDDVTVVHNGTRFSGSPVVPAGIEPDRPLVSAFVGRLVAFKRVDRFLRAIALTSADEGPRALIVGGGPLEETLIALARELGISERVSFLGYREDVDDLLDRVDVLVHPSHDEPFGLAIVEACGRGVLPCIFADGGGAVEVIPPDGRIVGSVEELAEALVALQGSASLGRAAREARARWARDAFPIERTADHYAQLYRRALSRG